MVSCFVSVVVALPAFTVVALLAVAATSSATNTGSGDPRCPAGYDPMQHCPSSRILPGGAGFDLTRNVDPTTCNDQENCARCLGDDAWQKKLIEEIGLYSAVRDPSFKPWINADNWLSLEIISTITMLLLRDTMNISARAATMLTNGNTDTICCSEPLLHMELWDTSGSFINDTAERTTASRSNGYTGQSGIFVPPYTLKKYPLGFSYLAYELLEDYKHISFPAFSTACTNMTVNAALGCVDGNYVCDTNGWTNTTCYQGWYVPPQCNIPGEVGNPSTSHCQEVIMADPTYDAGSIEGMIKNNGLNMTAAYVGIDRHNAMVRDLVARKEDFLFYWYYPDPLVSQVGAKMIEFIPNTATCTAERSLDPTLNKAVCAFPVLDLKKNVRADALTKDADFNYFFESFELTASQMDSLLVQHKSAGGNFSVYDLSCNWIKNNYDTWKGMVRNTPPTTAPSLAASSGGILSNAGALAALIAAPILLVGAIVFAAVYKVCKRRMELQNAPRKAPLAMIFTDIENSTMLWEVCGDDMGKAVEIHHAIIRRHIEEFNAYEVKTIGDSFMIACHSLGDATMLCLAIQTSLGECRTFPPCLRYTADPVTSLNTSGGGGGGERSRASSVKVLDDVLFMESLGASPGSLNDMSIVTPRSAPAISSPTASVDGVEMLALREGATSRVPSISQTSPRIHSQGKGGGGSGGDFNYPLRVRIGLHWCQEVNPRMDRIHGRFDYYGHDVNVCARIEGQALGGQILVSSETMDAITETDDFPLLIAPDSMSVIVKRDVELKGVSERVTLFALAPISQIASGYIKSKLFLSESRTHSLHRTSSVTISRTSSTISPTAATTNTTEYSDAPQRHIKASVNYATALLRATFKAVPESSKGQWLTALSKTLRIKSSAPSDGPTGHTRLFDALRAAVQENCTQSLGSSHSTDEGGTTHNPSAASVTVIPDRRTSTNSQDFGTT